MPVSTNDFANKLWKAANFYDEFGLSPKTATLLYAASNIARSVSGLVDKNDELKAENAKLRELVRELYSEYRYLRVRFHRTYVQHEERMRAIERRMRELEAES